MPCAFVLLGFSLMLPESPRWLAQKERYEEMHVCLRRLYSDEGDEFFARTEVEIREQIHFEAIHRQNTHIGHAMIELFNSRNRRRTLVAIIVGQLQPLAGVSVIQNYQSILYGSLGFTGKKALLISAIYGFMGLIGQIINLLGISDKWPRVRTMWIGSLVLAACLSLLMALSKFYGDGSDISGARAGIAFIFIYSAVYAIFFNSTINTVIAEIFPVHLRGYGMSLCAFATGVTTLWLGQVTPYAFDAISWKFYSVFIACCVVLAVLFKLYLKEMNQMSLESIAGQWGDETINTDKAIAAHDEEMAHDVVAKEKSTAPRGQSETLAEHIDRV